MKRKQFTLIELLIVIAIIAVLASLLFAAVGASRNRAKFTRWEGSRAAVAARSMIYFDFQEKDGAILENQGQKHPNPSDANGKANGDPEWDTGRWTKKGSIKLDGTDDFFDCGAQPSLRRAAASSDPSLTLMAWIKPSSTSGEQFIISNSNGTSYDYMLSLSGSSIKAYMGSTGYTESTSISTGRWYHIVAVYENNTSTDYIRIYLDGIQLSTPPQTANFDYLGARPPSGSPTHTIIGAKNTAGDNEFNGYIDEISIIPEALTSDEIKKIYTQGEPEQD